MKDYRKIFALTVTVIGIATIAIGDFTNGILLMIYAQLKSKED